MIQLTKKIFVLSVVFLFLGSGIYTVSAKQIETTTVYRYSPNGDVTSFQIKYDDSENLKNVLMNLLENDNEIQTYIQNILSNDTDDGKNFCMIISKGKGMHFQLPLLQHPNIKRKINFVINFLKNPYTKLWHLLLLRAVYKSIKPSIYISCKYRFDSNAETILAPLRSGQTQTVIGPHQVKSTGFIGYTSWKLPRAKIGHLLIPLIYVGFATNTTLSMY